jgi:hypothetical protein
VTKYLTPDEAAGDVLGWRGKHRGQKLLRYVRRKERMEKRQIAVRGPGQGNGNRYLLTEAMLRLHFPEFFVPHVDALAQELHKRIDDICATIGAEIDERMAPQVQQLRATDEKLGQQVVRLARSTNDGFQRIERRIAKLEKKDPEQSRQESSA